MYFWYKKPKFLFILIKINKNLETINDGVLREVCEGI